MSEEIIYQSKLFYKLTGLKRSTVRHYEEEGLLSPSRIDANGYAYYTNRDLVDAMLIKNSRGLDFGVRDIRSFFEGSVNEQIERLSEKASEYRNQICLLMNKAAALERYERLLRDATDIGKLRVDSVGQEMRYFPLEAGSSLSDVWQREVEHCVVSFPMVHIAARGSLVQMKQEGVLRLIPGYEYRPDNGFLPLCSELYTTLPPCPVLLIRLRLQDPLIIPETSVLPLLEEADHCGMRVKDNVYACISARDRQDGVSRYYLSLRILGDE